MTRLTTPILLVAVTLLLSESGLALEDDLNDVRNGVRSGLLPADRPIARWPDMSTKLPKTLPRTPDGGAFPFQRDAVAGASPPVERASSVYLKSIKSVVLIGTRDGFGAGTIVSAQGGLVTNEHVVQNAYRAHGAEWVAVWFKPAASGAVDLDKFLLARVIQKNTEWDLALLQLADPMPDGASAVPLAATPPAVGQEVFTIGHPKAYLWSFAQGVVAQMRPFYAWSYNDGIRRRATAIQTQTPLNPGSSGGPLLNGHSEIVGVVVGAAPEAQGIHFAVSGEYVKELLKR